MGLFFFRNQAIVSHMVVRMRHTRSHTANRRSHHALVGATISNCANCGAARLRHTVCMECGFYRGKKVIDMVAKMEKKNKKRKEKEKTAGK